MFQWAIDYTVTELRIIIAKNAIENNIPERILLSKDREVAQRELHVRDISVKVKEERIQILSRRLYWAGSFEKDNHSFFGLNIC